MYSVGQKRGVYESHFGNQACSQNLRKILHGSEDL
jgi:hypothetical protein